MDSGSDMEEFHLFRHKPRCRGTDQMDNGADILFEDWHSDDPDIPTPTGAQTIWNNKTQGRPGHIPLLAIACLFADRFPDAVKISGDVTAGQCGAAVRLANQYLEGPFFYPYGISPLVQHGASILTESSLLSRMRERQPSADLEAGYGS